MHDFASDFMPVEGEKPLDRYVPDGGAAAILRKVCVIGDSLASGEFESLDDKGKPGYHDMYEYSWGKFLGRIAGLEVNVFAKSGMTAKEYMESFADKNGFWADDVQGNAYIIALGVNDVLNCSQPVGTLDDTDREEKTDTFAWYFGSLVKRLRKINPKCRLFFVTMPRMNDPSDALRSRHARFLNEFARKLGFAYVLDFFNNVPVYDKKFYSRFFLGSHMNAAGYLFTARVMASYIDWIIRNNWDDFVQIPFVRTNYCHKDYK